MSTSHGPDAPRRNITTPWGELQAVGEHPHRIRVTSYLGPERRSDAGELAINGEQFWFEALLSRAPLDHSDRHHHQYLDPTWHHSRHLGWSLRRPHGRGSTEAEEPVSFVRTKLLPLLVVWLNDTEATKLLDEAETYWRDSCQSDSETAEQRLNDAIARIVQLREAVAGGEILSVADEQLLRTGGLPTDDPDDDSWAR